MNFTKIKTFFEIILSEYKTLNKINFTEIKKYCKIILTEHRKICKINLKIKINKHFPLCILLNIKTFESLILLNINNFFIIYSTEYKINFNN